MGVWAQPAACVMDGDLEPVVSEGGLDLEVAWVWLLAVGVPDDVADGFGHRDRDVGEYLVSEGEGRELLADGLAGAGDVLGCGGKTDRGSSALSYPGGRSQKRRSSGGEPPPVGDV